MKMIQMICTLKVWLQFPLQLILTKLSYNEMILTDCFPYQNVLH